MLKITGNRERENRKVTPQKMSLAQKSKGREEGGCEGLCRRASPARRTERTKALLGQVCLESSESGETSRSLDQKGWRVS